MRRRPQAGARRRAGNPLVVAAVTILLAVAITYYAFSGKQIPFVHHFTMHALVRNSVYIIPGSPVRIAGIDVGKVTDAAADGTLTRLSFQMDSNGLPVHKDATVTIRDRLFLEGGYYLQLDPGSPGAPSAGDGYTIPVSNTGLPGSVLPAALDVQPCHPPEPRERADDAERGVQRARRAAADRRQQRRRRLEGGDPAADPGAERRRLGDAGPARPPGRCRRAASAACPTSAMREISRAHTIGTDLPIFIEPQRRDIHLCAPRSYV